MTKSNGYLHKRVRTRGRTLVSLLILVLVVLAFSACKADSTLEIKLQSSSKGTLEFKLNVDEEAASFLRDDAFTKQTFDDVFQTKKLKEAGFKVEIKENTDGKDSSIIVKKSFGSQAQLKSTLKVFADEKVVDATLDATTTFTNENTKLNLSIDLSKLKEQYLDDSLKEKVTSAGYNWDQYKALVEKGFESTTLKVTAMGDKKTEKTLSTSDEKTTFAAEKNSFRSGFVFSIIAGIACLGLGAIMLWRFCRRGGVLSSHNELGGTRGKDENNI